MNTLDKILEVKGRINRSLDVYGDVPAYLVEEYNSLFNLLTEEEKQNALVY